MLGPATTTRAAGSITGGAAAGAAVAVPAAATTRVSSGAAVAVAVAVRGFTGRYSMTQIGIWTCPCAGRLSRGRWVWSLQQISSKWHTRWHGNSRPRDQPNGSRSRPGTGMRRGAVTTTPMRPVGQTQRVRSRPRGSENKDRQHLVQHMRRRKRRDARSADMWIAKTVAPIGKRRTVRISRDDSCCHSCQRLRQW